MAETDWTPEELASSDRVGRYNVRDYDAVTNEFGFGEDGYLVNQMRQADDGGVLARAAQRFALYASSQAILAVQEAAAAKAERIAAQNAATNAYAARDKAQLWANAAEDQEVEAGKFSAFHWVRKAIAQVALAAAEVVRARTEADRAQGYAAGVNMPPITAADAGRFPRAKADRSGYELIDLDLFTAALVKPVPRTANTVIAKANKGNLIDITSGTFTQTFASAATLTDGFFCYVRNSGTGDITLDPNGSELIDGLSSFVMYPGEVRLILSDGAALRSVVVRPGSKTFTTSGTLVWPPGVNGAIVEARAGQDGGGGGGSGGRGAAGNGANTAGGGGGGGASGVVPAPIATIVKDVAPGTQVNANVGAGGLGGAGAAQPSNAQYSTAASGGGLGGSSSFGSFLTAIKTGFASNNTSAPGGPGQNSTDAGGGGAGAGGVGVALSGSVTYDLGFAVLARIAGLTGFSGLNGTQSTASGAKGGDGAGTGAGAGGAGGAIGSNGSKGQDAANGNGAGGGGGGGAGSRIGNDSSTNTHGGGGGRGGDGSNGYVSVRFY